MNKPMRPYLLLLTVMLSLGSIFKANAAATISSTVTSEMEVCLNSESFELVIVNDSTATLTNVSVVVALPSGIRYVYGSLFETTYSKVQEQNVVKNNNLIFSSGNIPAGDSIKFSIAVAAFQDAITFQDAGNIFRNTVTIHYDGGSETHVSDAYNILYPALTILSVSPNAATILSGNSLTRNVTVINGGNGKASTVYLTDVRNASTLTLDATSLGTISGDTIVLSGSDFNGVGNSDNYLDQNESFTLTQTLSGTSCVDVTVTSAINAHWGCDGDLLSTSTSYGNVSIDFQSPKLALSGTEVLEDCFGSGAPSNQTMRIVNKGTGVASNIDVSIFKSTGGTYNQTIFSRFDPASLQYKVGQSGAFTTVTGMTSTATQNTGDYSCLGTNPVGKMDFTLVNIQPGDTIYVAWDMYSCCVQTCNNEAVKGWRAELSYSDVCATTLYTASLNGQSRNNHLISFTTETPTDIIDGEDEDFTFIVSSFENDLPAGDGASYKVTFTLELGLVYENLKFHSNGVQWTPQSINYSSNVVTAFFPAAAPFTVPKSEMELTLSGSCGSPGWKTIEMDLAYLPDTSCTTGCEIPMECDLEVETYLHCPAVGCAGPNVLAFSVLRTNFGLPDNNLDGMADGSGALNLSEIKRNRAMVGDTIETVVTSFVKSSGTTWNYGAFTSSIDYGSVLSFVNATLTIYDSSAATHFIVTNLTPTTSISNHQQDFSFDLATANLSALNPALSGYSYAGGDSIELRINYRVSDNVNGLLQETTFLNEFYLSAVANPSNGQKEYCNFKNGRITLIGYDWRNNSQNSLTVTSCTKVVNQYWGMSIGDLSSNYGGGNLFPYEYRYWGQIKEAWLVLPPNYSHVNTILKHWGTKKTNSTNSQTVNNVSPDQVTGDTLYYNMAQYYSSGQFKKSDDGFHGRIQVEIAPNCDVPENQYEDMVWIFNYEKSDAIDGAESGQVLASSNDRIRYKRSALQPISANPTQDANTRKVVWDYKLKNTSSSGADNAWIHFIPPSNFTIDSVVNDATGALLTLQNDIYRVGEIKANASADLSIHGTFSSCDTVRVLTYTGYECTGYPTDFASFACPYENYSLYVEPKPSAYQTRISTELGADPCNAELELEIDITSVKLAHMFDMTIDYITPDTQKISVKPNTSEFLYNISNAYTSIADPAYDNGSKTYSFDINDYNSAFALDGIPGVLDINNNRYKLSTTLKLGDQFQNGDFLQVQINGANACNVPLQTINLAIDPNMSFEKDNTAGLHLDNIDSWSASWGDYTGDGYDDLFVPSKDVNAQNLLYQNNQDGTFTKITSGPVVEDLGAAVAGTWGDYDNDGDVDLFVTYQANAPNRLYRNNGDSTFTRVANSVLSQGGIYGHSAAWADYNKDGNLDLMVANYHVTHFNHLYYGDGNGGFTKDQNSVIAQSATSAVGVAWGDYDNDGDADLFLANTNGENNQLFRNDAGLFVEITSGNVVNDGGNSVGGTWGDYDSDGDLDLFVTNASMLEPNFLYNNNGDGTFTKVTSGAIVTDISNAHGASWIDYDNDGDLDLTVANDQFNNFLYSNNGDGTFTKLTNAITEETGNSFGVSWSDFDNDGDYDLYVANRGNSKNDFFINEKGSCTNHIVVDLEGCISNRDGIGARIGVKVTINGASVWQYKHVSTQTSGMAGQNSNKILFGLNDATAIDSLVVEWPSGVVSYLNGAAVNQIHKINEDCASKVCGMVFNDQNGNGVQDLGEKGIPNASLTVSPGGFKVYTDDNGYYQLYIGDGSYTIALDTNSKWTQTLPVANGGYTLVVDKATATEYCGNDFGRNAVCSDPDLSLSLGTTAFRRGLTNMLNVVVTNEGAYDATETIQVDLTMTDNVYILDTDWTQGIAPSGYRAYSLTFSGLDQLSDTIFELTDSVALSAGLDDLVTVEAEISYASSECDTTNNTYSMTDIVVGSIDPNDKMVMVQDLGKSEVAHRNEVLIYKIRFQNVGTYAARIVRIVDELSPDLDWSTFQMESSSHPFTVSVVDGVVEWVNRNIELPDSASNPEGSQGYVTFSILPKKDLKLYTLIENEAKIQFDYNDFIVTNNTQIYVKPIDYEPVVPVVTLYPNPTSDQVHVHLVDIDRQLIEMDRIEILDINGNTRQEHRGEPVFKKRLEVGFLPSGVYIVRAWNGEASYATKLVIL